MLGKYDGQPNPPLPVLPSPKRAPPALGVFCDQQVSVREPEPRVGFHLHDGSAGGGTVAFTDLVPTIADE